MHTAYFFLINKKIIPNLEPIKINEDYENDFSLVNEFLQSLTDEEQKITCFVDEYFLDDIHLVADENTYLTDLEKQLIVKISNFLKHYHRSNSK